MLKQSAQIAWRNILYTPRKSLFAISAVAACFFSLNFFQGYIAGTETIFLDSYSQRSMLGDLVVRREGIRHSLSMEETDFLDEHEQAQVEAIFQKLGIDNYVRFLRATGTITNGTAQTVFTASSHDVARGAKMREPTWGWNALAGRPLEGEDRSGILLGQALASLLHCEPTSSERYITGLGGYEARERPMKCDQKKLQLQSVTMSGQANALEVEVDGIIDAMFRDLDLRFAYLPLSVAQRLLNTKRISFYSARLPRGANETSLVESLRAELQAQHLKIVAQSWKEDEIGDFYQRTMNFLHIFRNFMVIVILGVALLSIFNTFYRSVQERVREIGVLRTLGFRVANVRFLFLLETFFLALIGIAIGGIFANIGAAAVNHLSILYKIGLLTQPVPFLVVLEPWMMVGSSLVVLGIALSAAFIPLLITGRMRITEALIHN